MKTLNQIKDEVAFDFNNSNWNTLYHADKVSNVIIDEVVKRYAKKVLAGIEGLPSIDWNGLEKEFGWVDVEELAKNALAESDLKSIDGSYNSFHYQAEAFIEGFKKAQSINEKKFSLEEVRLVWFAGQKYWETSGDSITFEELVERRKELLQPQPKVFNIEVQMEEYDHDEDWSEISGAFEICKYRPKITNNKIKIIKKL